MNEEENIKFVLEVEKHPCLYNTSLSSYSRMSKTDKAWEEVGKVMNMSGAACKNKWRNLRIVFSRHMKSSGKKKKPYYLLDVMKFLVPFLKQPVNNPLEPGILITRGTIEMETMSENTDDTTEDFETESTFEKNTENVNESTHNSKKRKLRLDEADKHMIEYLKTKSSRLSETQTSSDPVMSFLNSLAPELEEMNLEQFKTFKRKVFILIDDIMNTSAATTSTTTN